MRYIYKRLLHALVQLQQHKDIDAGALHLQHSAAFWTLSFLLLSSFHPKPELVMIVSSPLNFKWTFIGFR